MMAFRFDFVRPTNLQRICFNQLKRRFVRREASETPFVFVDLKRELHFSDAIVIFEAKFMFERTLTDTKNTVCEVASKKTSINYVKVYVTLLKSMQWLHTIY